MVWLLGLKTICTRLRACACGETMAKPSPTLLAGAPAMSAAAWRRAGDGAAGPSLRVSAGISRAGRAGPQLQPPSAALRGAVGAASGKRGTRCAQLPRAPAAWLRPHLSAAAPSRRRAARAARRLVVAHSFGGEAHDSVAMHNGASCAQLGAVAAYAQSRGRSDMAIQARAAPPRQAAKCPFRGQSSNLQQRTAPAPAPLRQPPELPRRRRCTSACC